MHIAQYALNEQNETICQKIVKNDLLTRIMSKMILRLSTTHINQI
jgi:hypothetical protein